MMNILKTRSMPFVALAKQKLVPVAFFITVLSAPIMVHAQSASPEAGLPSQEAQGAGGAAGSDRFRQRDPLAIYREAGINTDQETQIRGLAKQFEDANTAKLQSVMSQLQEMKTLSLKPEPDEDSVISKQEQINKLQGEMAMERIKLLLKIRHVLNAQQKQRLVELMQKNMAAQN
jgi:Spy/CpxP family protein refolding chaperone